MSRIIRSKLILLILILVIILTTYIIKLFNNKKVDRGSDNLLNTQEYKSVYSGEISTLNYLITSNLSEIGLTANLIDTLVDYDKYGIPQPALAEEWWVSGDNLKWTFKIREGVKWLKHDGREYGEVKAQDFVDSMEYILDSSNKSLTSNIIYNIIYNGKEYYDKEIDDFEEVGVKAVDEYILEYTLKKPVPYFLSMTTYVCFFPVNGEFLEELGEDFGTDNTKILYNGAYIMERFEQQYKRVLVANEKYWDRENVHINKLVSIYNKEATTLAPELFSRGEIDRTDISSTILNEWIKNPERKDLIRPNRTNYYTYFYALNFDPQFPEEFEPDNWKIAVNNISFRKAIFHALDRKAAVSTSEPYNPENLIQNTITPKNFTNYNGVDYTEIGDLKDIADKNTFNELKALGYRERAMRQLKDKVKFPVKILIPYNTNSVDWANRTQVIKQQMENLLGKDFIDIIIDPQPPTSFLENVRRAGQFALLECNWGPDYADPESFTDPFIPSGTYNKPELAKEYINHNGKSKYEIMINEAKGELIDIGKRYTLFANAEAFLINKALVIPYRLGGGGYSASRLNPFEAAYSPFGVSSERYKGLKVMDKPMTTEEFKKQLELWEKERIEAIKSYKY